MIDRRTFIKSSASLVFTGLVTGTFSCNNPSQPKKKLDKIGVQLYSIRSKLKDDFEGSLKKVAEIGYKEVEFAGYYERTPQQIAQLLKEFGLEAPATHIPLDIIKENLEETIEIAKTVGHKYLICPWVDKKQFLTIDSWKQLSDIFNKAGETCNTAGISFCYHNHDFEFEAIGEQLPMDIIINETDANLVNIELDLFWIKKGGYSALKYFKKYPGRFKLCHVKDMADEEKMVSVGSGNIDFASIFANSSLAGLQHYFVEHDNPLDPFASIETSFKYLSKLEF